MSHLVTKMRIAGITGRAFFYRSLISMAGRRTLWPTVIGGTLLLIMVLSTTFAGSGPHIPRSLERATPYTSSTAAGVAEAQPEAPKSSTVNFGAAAICNVPDNP